MNDLETRIKQLEDKLEEINKRIEDYNDKKQRTQDSIAKLKLERIVEKKRKRKNE